MVSKNQIKLITSLHQKKYRNQHQLFIAEGIKVIDELLKSSLELDHLFCTEPLFSDIYDDKKTIISFEDLKKMSTLTSPNNCLAIFKIPTPKPIQEKGLLVVLDAVRDPGNMGTILRLCDWFGVNQLLCSKETVDIYNPKVVQATMGSISRVQVNFLDINIFLKTTSLPIFGTFMDGKSIYNETFPKNAIVVFGNEANGISSEVATKIDKRIAIPRFGNLQETESLNVATATAIILNEFRRNSHINL